MKIGMLWYDNDPKTNMQQKIQKAAAHYENKYGTKPNLVYVHCGNGKCDVIGFEVRESNQVLPNHFWLGVADGTN